MSARLKLKNLKKRIEAIESYSRHCEHEMHRVRNILMQDMQTIGCNIELTSADTMRGALRVLDYNLREATHKIGKAWAQQLEQYIRDCIIDNYRLSDFGAIAIRVLAPKPTADFVKVERTVPRRFF